MEKRDFLQFTNRTSDVYNLLNIHFTNEFEKLTSIQPGYDGWDMNRRGLFQYGL